MGASATRTSVTLAVALAGLLAPVSAALAKPQPGDLDRSFSGNGLVRTQVDGSRGAANSVAIGRKHRIVVAGGNSTGFALARYTPDGRLDRSFSGDGMHSTAFGVRDAAISSATVRGGGAIIAAGTVCSDSGECRFAVANYKSDGHLLRVFGHRGKVTFDFGGTFASASSLAVDSRRGILVAGTTCEETHCDFALARLHRNGELHRGFGNKGRVVTRFDPENPTAHAGISSIAIDSRDRIIAGGSASGKRVALARYTKNGYRSRLFGQHGVALKDLDRLGEVAGIALTRTDRIVAVGADKRNPNKEWALARFGHHGGLDDSFGDGGQVTTSIPGRRRVDAHEVAIDSGNRIVATGAPGFSLARYQPDGSLDRSFGRHGKVTQDFGHGWAYSVAIDSHDRPVAAGWAMRRFAVARFVG